ncbi:MAG TPA: ribonuclease P protein component [Vicinamibacterales bacterium]|nr:ribonuclease P protein component [Vicinamibacterales bacterium]
MTFRPAEHIRKRADFEQAYDAGARVSGRFMTVFVRANTDGHARLGIAATRKIGGAVIRNRAKRLTRELFRQHKPVVALDIVVIPRREFLDAPYPSLEREFGVLLERAGDGTAAARPRRPRRPRSDSRV